MHVRDGSAMQGLSSPAATKSPALAGLNSAIPSGVFRIGKGLLGETVQLALTMSISHRDGARCDGRHVLAPSDPFQTGQQWQPGTQRNRPAGQ